MKRFNFRRIPWTHPDAITQMFDWDDPNVYQWTIRGTRSPFRILHVVGPVIGVGLIIPVCGVFVSLIAYIGLVFIYSIVIHMFGIDPFGKALFIFKVGTGIAATVIILILNMYLVGLSWWGPSEKRVQAQGKLDELLTSSIGIVAFVLVELTSSGFTGSIDSLNQWLRFFLQHAVRAISLDFSETLDLRFSDIEPLTWYARLGTVLFRFLIAAGLVNFLWQVYRRRFRREVISATVKECYYTCKNLLDRDTLGLQRDGRVDLFKTPERRVAIADFLEGVDDRAYEEERHKNSP